jgi:hypothetical protein
MRDILKNENGLNRISEAFGSVVLAAENRLESSRHRNLVIEVRQAAVGVTAEFAAAQAQQAARTAESIIAKGALRHQESASIMAARYRQHEWERIAALMERDGHTTYDPARDSGEHVR